MKRVKHNQTHAQILNYLKNLENGCKVLPSCEMGQLIIILLVPYIKLRVYSQFFFLAKVRREKHSNTTGKLSGL